MAFIHFLCILLLLAAPICGTDGDDDDFYSSISGMENLLEIEYLLMENLRDYVNREHDKLQEINLLLKDFENENAKALNNSNEYFSSPINVFKTIKRSVVDFKYLESYILQQHNEVEYERGVTEIETDVGISMANEDDLNGAALGLARLQKTYQLNISDLFEGRLLGVQYRPAMSLSELYFVGKSLYDTKRYKMSFEWLLIAWEKFSNESKKVQDEWDVVDKVTLLEQFGASAYRAGHLQIAHDMMKDLLVIDRENGDVHENNIRKVEMDMLMERNTPKRRWRRVKDVKPKLADLYEATCRGDLKQTPAEERPLRCMYVNNNVPFLRIAPFKLEQLNLDPLIVYYHEVIYENEIEQVLDTAAPQILRSKVRSTSESTTTTARTSKNAWLYFDKHDFLDNIKQRLIDMTQLSLDTAEALQVANYGIGGHYGPHFDFSATPNESYGAWMGNRIATALFYITDVELGGATAFPVLKLAVKPIRRSLVFWYNLHDSTDPDYRMKHAGCPVIKGSKWILNEWLHERGQEFLRPCGLQSTSYLSAAYK